MGEVSILHTDVLSKVVYYLLTLPALFASVCMDGTVYILPFSTKCYKPCVMIQPVELRSGADFGSERMLENERQAF